MKLFVVRACRHVEAIIPLWHTVVARILLCFLQLLLLACGLRSLLNLVVHHLRLAVSSVDLLITTVIVLSLTCSVIVIRLLLLL